MHHWKYFLLIAVLLAACTRSTPAARKDQLRFPIFAEPQSWDTTTAQDDAALAILFSMTEGLTKHERYGKVIPALAEHWELSKDSKQLTFFLRAAKWSDGRDVRAEDFVFAWQRLLDPKNTNPAAARFFSIDKAEDYHAGRVTNFAEVGVKATEPGRLVLALAHPDGALLDTLSLVAAAPQRADLVAGTTDAFSSPEKLRVTGPYLARKWEKGSQLQLVANPEYYSRRPPIAQVTLYWFKDVAAASSKYDKGELDVLMPVPTGENEKWKQSLDFEAVAVLKSQSTAALVAQPQYEKIGVMTKPYLETFPIDIFGHALFADARFKQENASEP